MSSSDPNMYIHSSGNVECKVCLSTHANITAYLSHAQGKMHNKNMERYSKKHLPESKIANSVRQKPKQSIGIPQYDIIKIRDTERSMLGFRAEFQLDKLSARTKPQSRIMSSYEQTVEELNTNYQYLVVAADPYDTVAVRIPTKPIMPENLITHYDEKRMKYYVQVLFEI